MSFGSSEEAVMLFEELEKMDTSTWEQDEQAGLAAVMSDLQNHINPQSFK